MEKDDGYKQPEPSNNAQVQGKVENKEEESRIDKGSPESESSKKVTETGHFCTFQASRFPRM